jgi:hypothetical protein
MGKMKKLSIYLTPQFGESTAPPKKLDENAQPSKKIATFAAE